MGDVTVSEIEWNDPFFCDCFDNVAKIVNWPHDFPEAEAIHSIPVHRQAVDNRQEDQLCHCNPQECRNNRFHTFHTRNEGFSHFFLRKKIKNGSRHNFSEKKNARAAHVRCAVNLPHVRLCGAESLLLINFPASGDGMTLSV